MQLQHMHCKHKIGIEVVCVGWHWLQFIRAKTNCALDTFAHRPCLVTVGKFSKLMLMD